jgi:hypothetical protein
MVVGLWAALAGAQEEPAPAPKPAAAAAGETAETLVRLECQIRVLTAQVKALQASVAQCQQQLARANQQNRQEDDTPASPNTTKTPPVQAVPHPAVVHNNNDDSPAPAVKTGLDKTADIATTRESVYANDPGVQAVKAAMEQYLKDLKALEDKTLTDVQKSKISTDAATKLGKILARKICITAVVQNVTVSAGNKAAISTLSNSVREMMEQSKQRGLGGGGTNPTFHVTLTEDQAAMIRKGDEMLVNGSCTVSKDVTAGGTASAQDVVVIAVQGGWNMILGDFTCKTGTISAKGVKSSTSKSAVKPAKNAAKKPTITNTGGED